MRVHRRALISAAVAIVTASLALAAIIFTARAAVRPLAVVPSSVPRVMNYQGYLTDSQGVPKSGSLPVTFTIFDAENNGTSHWSEAQQLQVDGGYFDTLLGKHSELDPAIYAVNSELWLELQVESDPALPRQRLTTSPYAFRAVSAESADTVAWSGILGRPPGTINVATSGADFTSIQAAIDSISDASSTNKYLIQVAPGVYSETVTMKPGVHLQGAGRELTEITSIAPASTSPTATLILASDVTIRDLSVTALGPANNLRVGIDAAAGTTSVLLERVAAHADAQGGADSRAIHVDGIGTALTLVDVSTFAEGATLNYGLHVYGGPEITVRDSSFEAQGGNFATGVYLYLSATLRATDISATAYGATSNNVGLWNSTNSFASLSGGIFTGDGGSVSAGLYNSATGASLTAHGVRAVGTGATTSRGFWNGSIGPVLISNSILEGETYSSESISNIYTLSNSHLVGLLNGSATCLLVSRAGVATLGPTCP